MCDDTKRHAEASGDTWVAIDSINLYLKRRTDPETSRGANSDPLDHQRFAAVFREQTIRCSLSSRLCLYLGSIGPNVGDIDGVQRMNSKSSRMPPGSSGLVAIFPLAPCAVQQQAANCFEFTRFYLWRKNMMTYAEGAMDFDPINAIETLYRTDLTGSGWLAAVIEALQPALDPQHGGLHSALYYCPDPLTFMPEQFAMHEFGDHLLVIFREFTETLTEEFAVGSVLCPGVLRGTAIAGWNDIDNKSFFASGFVDALYMFAVEPDGNGCGICNFRREPVAFSLHDKHMLGSLSRHFSAAHRLQRKLRGHEVSPNMADAVLDSNGRLCHAQRSAVDSAVQRQLRAAVRQSEAARGRQRRSDPHGALDAWGSMVAGRWTFVDHFDHDGRRYLLALDNSARPPGLDLLSPRERNVVDHALRGSSNKVIAYDLGIQHSTVKVLMARAAQKLGVRTRQQLLDKLRVVAGS